MSEQARQQATPMPHQHPACGTRLSFVADAKGKLQQVDAGTAGAVEGVIEQVIPSRFDQAIVLIGGDRYGFELSKLLAHQPQAKPKASKGE